MESVAALQASIFMLLNLNLIPETATPRTDPGERGVTWRLHSEVSTAHECLEEKKYFLETNGGELKQ